MEMQSKGKAPPWLANRPRIGPEAAPYLQAFDLLDGAREWNEVGPQAIRISEVESLLNIYGIDLFVWRERYLRLLMSLDTIYLKATRAKLGKT